MTDSDAENSETQAWLEFALKCEYINQRTIDDFKTDSEEVSKLLNYMIKKPNKIWLNLIYCQLKLITEN